MDRHNPPTRITFISAAATAAVRRAAFPVDDALDESVRAEIAALNWIAPRAQKIYAAPEKRTQQTADALKLSYTDAEALRDCDYGRWSGSELSEIESREPENVMTWLMDVEAAPHGGESVKALMDRSVRWLEEQRGVGHVIAVTHPAIIRAAVVYAMEAPLRAFWRVDIAPLSVTDLRFNGRAWTLRSVGCAL